MVFWRRYCPSGCCSHRATISRRSSRWGQSSHSPLTRFTDGSGPVFGGKIFPFAFITVACGAISGFHSLISSGTTPKMLEHEGDARMVGYGCMMMESFVAVMAMIAAIIIKPGIYFAVNAPAGGVGAGGVAAGGGFSG